MDFFITSTVLNIKKLFKKRATLVAFILLPVTIFFVSSFLSESPVSISIGVIYDSTNYKHLDILKNLNTNEIINFVSYTDINTMKQDIKTNTIFCGYIFGDNLYGLAPTDFSNAITVVAIEGTFGIAILNEIVTAAVMPVIVPSITTATLNARFPDDYEAIDAFVASQLDYFSRADIFMSPDFTGFEGNTENFSASNTNGILGLIITSLLVFLIPYYIEEKNSGVVTALGSKKVVYYLSLFVSLVFTMFCLALLGFNFDILPLFIFILMSTALTVLSILLLKTPNFIQSLGLFIILLNIFFGGVLLDLNEISPTLGRVQYVFPLFWYAQGGIF